MNKSASPSRPIVSLGLPVFNGENYIVETLDSILSQTFTDFELIISDNASTDETQRICEEYARTDDRIRYIRQPENQGAAANYDFVFLQSTGVYFKWCPHDDVLGANMLEDCVAVLETSSDAVGAVPSVTFVDGDRNKIKDLVLPIDPSDQNTLSRFKRALWMGTDWLVFFGLFRRDLVARTGLHGNYVRSDHVFVSEMLLMGPILYVPSSNLQFRRHSSSFTESVLKSQSDAIAWMDPRFKGTRTFRETRYYYETTKAVLRSEIGLGEKASCLREVFSVAWRRKRRHILRELSLVFYRNGQQTALRKFFRQITKKT